MGEAESARLRECETVIERGCKSVFEMGLALLEIRNGRLYRKTHRTFEEYCRERWELSRIHAYRMLNAARVSRLLPVGNSNAPTTEAQVRPLTSLGPEFVVVAWNSAVRTAAGGNVTAAHVKAAVNRILDRGNAAESARKPSLPHRSNCYYEELVVKELNRIRLLLKRRRRDEIIHSVERIKVLIDRLCAEQRLLTVDGIYASEHEDSNSFAVGSGLARPRD